MEETQESKIEDPVAKDMLIGEVVSQYPQAADVFLKYGLHCVGCHISPYETVEQGAMGHGMDAETVDKMVAEANKVISEGPAPAEKEKIDVSNADFSMTEAATNKLKEIMKQEQKENAYFRVAIVPGGCSGFGYHFDLEEGPKEDDKVMDKADIKVLIDDHSLSMMNGATIDYVETLQGAGFKVDNPNAKSSCGCGNSFS